MKNETIKYFGSDPFQLNLNRNIFILKRLYAPCINEKEKRLLDPTIQIKLVSKFD